LEGVPIFFYIQHADCLVIVDVPHMRQADIKFALAVVPHAISQPASKTTPVTEAVTTDTAGSNR
jgi:hypothetical protein